MCMFTSVFACVYQRLDHPPRAKVPAPLPDIDSTSLKPKTEHLPGAINHPGFVSSSPARTVGPLNASGIFGPRALGNQSHTVASYCPSSNVVSLQSGCWESLSGQDSSPSNLSLVFKTECGAIEVAGTGRCFGQTAVLLPQLVRAFGEGKNNSATQFPWG